MRRKTNGIRLLMVGALTFGLLMAVAEHAAAWHLHGGFHRHSHFALGFHFYGYPYSPYYYPYYYSPYYYAYQPGEHRRFPAFRLPGAFHYPGALGKGEAGDR